MLGVEPLPLHRLSEHHQGGARRRRRNAQAMMRDSSAVRSRAWRIGRWSRVAAASRPTYRFRASSTCASCGRRFAHGRITCRSTPRAALGAARRARGVDRRRCRRHSADRLPPHAHRRARALSPAGAGASDRVRYVGEPVAVGVRRGSVSRRGRGRAGRRSRSRSCRRCWHASAPPGEFETRAGRPSRPSSARAMATSRPRSAPPHAVVELDLAVGRHSGVPHGDARRRSPATTPAATSSNCTAPPRCRTGTAIRSPACWAAIPRLGASLRGPCRRRLRHPRRALSRGRAGLRRRACASGGR